MCAGSPVCPSVCASISVFQIIQCMYTTVSMYSFWRLFFIRMFGCLSVCLPVRVLSVFEYPPLCLSVFLFSIRHVVFLFVLFSLFFCLSVCVSYCLSAVSLSSCFCKSCCLSVCPFSVCLSSCLCVTTIVWFFDLFLSVCLFFRLSVSQSLSKKIIKLPKPCT